MQSVRKQPLLLNRTFPILVPLIAVGLALLIGVIFLLALGANPIDAYRALVQGAFGSRNSIADTLVRATPLLFVAVGVCIAFRGGVFNIGGEGQFIAGALLSTIVGLSMSSAPGWLIIIVSLTMGFIGGAIWGGIAGFLKARFNVNEILSTIMLNSIAVQLMNYLLGGPWMDPEQVAKRTFLPETARLPMAADLPRLVPTRLHIGALLAVVLAVAVWVLLWRTTIGYRIRAVGLNIFAARYAGIPVDRYAMLALTLSGALAGLGGAVQVFGVTHRLVTDGSPTGFTGNAGYNGIVVALFGGLHPLGAIPASILFGALLVGANNLQRTVQVPSSLAIALNGLIVIFVVSSEYLRQRARARAALEETTQPAAVENLAHEKLEEAL